MRLTLSHVHSKAGYEAIAVSKQNGSWNVLDEVEAITIPKDLEIAFKKKPGSKEAFLSLSKSTRKLLLMKLMFSKRPKHVRLELVRSLMHANIVKSVPIEPAC